MAGEVWRFSVTIPAGTLQAAPLAFSLPMPPRIVDEVEVVVPPGPRGEVGWQLGSGGIQILPVTPGQFLVTDNEKIAWPLEDQITSGAWQMIAYNTGTFNHTLEVRFLVRRTGQPGPTEAPALLESTALSS